MMKTIKKTILIFIILVMLLSASVMAATSLAVSSSTVNPGNTLTIWGATDAARFVSVRIVDDLGNIVYFGGTEADLGGNYSTVYTVPSDMAAGNLYITTGSGSDTAAATVTVVIPAATPQRAQNPQTGERAGTLNDIWMFAVFSVLVLAFYLLKRRNVWFS